MAEEAQCVCVGVCVCVHVCEGRHWLDLLLVLESDRKPSFKGSYIAVCVCVCVCVCVFQVDINTSIFF